MHHLIIYEIVFIVIIQSILALLGDKPKLTNPCPSDFLRIYNKCYYFSSEYETWNKAKWKCEERNSTLAVINNKSQNKALAEFLRKGYFEVKEPLSPNKQTHVPRWMGGLHDYESRRWIWVYNGKMIRYSDFSNDISKDLPWRCLAINPHKNYKWDAIKCFERNYYICQTQLSNKTPQAANITATNVTNIDATIHSNETTIKESKPKPKKKFICPKGYIILGRKCYFLSRDKEKWDDAFYKCQNMSSELAILKNKRMNARLQAKVKKLQLPTEKRWIGGRQSMNNNEWVWAATGAKLPFQPHMTVDSKWACLLWDPLGDRWTSDTCFLPMYYMCQTTAKPINKKFPMRKLQKSLQSRTIAQNTN